MSLWRSGASMVLETKRELVRDWNLNASRNKERVGEREESSTEKAKKRL
jgi:hypothetical protein